jgi:hypothetical protein
MGSGEVEWDNVIGENLRRGRRNIRYLISSLPKELPLSKTFSSPPFQNTDLWTEMGCFSFSLPLERGMEEVFWRGGKELFKRLFLQCHGQGGLIVCEGRGVWVFSFFFLLSSKVLTQHWALASFDETLSYQLSD